MSTLKEAPLWGLAACALLLLICGRASVAQGEKTLGQDPSATASAIQSNRLPVRPHDGLAARPPKGQQYHLGVRPTASQIAGWNIDVRADGQGLPPGSGTVSQGKIIFAQKCASCHGAQGQGKPMDQLVGGRGTLNTAKPIRTVGSYWPYATSVYDYIHRAMPFNAPDTLTPSEVYAVTAYLLYLNKIVPANAVMNARTLPRVKMPNRNGFYQPDPRPDTRNKACMKNCRSKPPQRTNPPA